jgi:hypothetical protein
LGTKFSPLNKFLPKRLLVILAQPFLKVNLLGPKPIQIFAVKQVFTQKVVGDFGPTFFKG